MQQANEYIIIANGEFLDKEALLACIQNKIVIALDGAADKLADYNIKPNFVLGDFDSVADINKWKNEKSVEIILRPDQNKTDCEKAIEFLDEMGAAKIEIICSWGGRIDHELYQLNLLKKFHNPKRPLEIITKTQRIFYCSDVTLRLENNIGANFACFGFPVAEITSKGLKYEMTDCKLELSKFASVSNSFVTEQINVQVKGSAIIVMEL